MTDHSKLVNDFRKAMFVDHDPAAVARLYAEDAVMKDAASGEVVRGRNAIADYHGTYLKAFPDPSAEALNVFGSGDWFAAEFRITGTHSAPLHVGSGEPIPPSGRRIALDVCWIGRSSLDGLCAEDHTYYDGTAFQQAVQGEET